MYSLTFGLLMVLVAVSCVRESEYSELLTQDYPELYKHIFKREADSILTFTDHPKIYVRQQAWRALISTPVENIDELITKVQNADIYEAWVALSAHELNNNQLSRLHDLWEQQQSLRKEISLVLGKQGNQQSLDFLARNFDKIIDSAHEFESALAIGRLMMNYELSGVTRRSILRFAAVIEDEDLFRAYYYGLYRGGEAVNEQMQQTLIETYEWTDNAKIKQYALGILFNSDAERTLERLNINGVAQMDIQLAVEWAQHTGKLDWSDKLEHLYTNLLDHSNPVVNETALNQIRNHPGKPAEFDEVIIEKIIENEEREASVRLSGIQALSTPDGFIELTDALAEKNEYLLIKKLNIYKKTVSPDEFLYMLEDYVESENRMEALFASQALSGWWNETALAQKNSTRKEEVRELIFELLNRGDRAITYVTVPFMQSSGLVEHDDYGFIEGLLSQYNLPEDVEVYQVFGSFLKEQFEGEAKSLIDSLAQKGNLALNNILRQQGWDIPEVESVSKKFRQPNWERLSELGYEPTWVLETEKGTIKIAMNVLSAPATISGMDSLTKAGAYDGVAFHRVVPNFVIQGGDVESGDGFGGPGYVVLTEASEKQYWRGVVGIASAGTDTEGSQYFMMHQWKPHLNGLYTIIGEVTDGMEVVDQILVGDKVTKVYWQTD